MFKEYKFQQYVSNICEHMSITPEILFSDQRVNGVALARKILFYICSVHGNMKVVEILHYLKQNGKEMSRVAIYKGIDDVEKLVKQDEDYPIIVNHLSNINVDEVK
tara:strand:+ start:2163 stop:2480 length:318 start_codon:yes stop_codon:yes gene_type:complete